MQNEFTADMKSEAIVSDGSRTIGYVDGDPAEWEGNLSDLEIGGLFWACGDDSRFHDGNEEYLLDGGEWKTEYEALCEHGGSGLVERIENEIRVNEGRITEERLSNIATDFLPADADEQAVMEKEIEIEEMIEKMGGTIIR